MPKAGTKSRAVFQRPGDSGLSGRGSLGRRWAFHWPWLCRPPRRTCRLTVDITAGSRSFARLPSCVRRFEVGSWPCHRHGTPARRVMLRRATWDLAFATANSRSGVFRMGLVLPCRRTRSPMAWGRILVFITRTTRPFFRDSIELIRPVAPRLQARALFGDSARLADSGGSGRQGP